MTRNSWLLTLAWQGNKDTDFVSFHAPFVSRNGTRFLFINPPITKSLVLFLKTGKENNLVESGAH